ncbi:MAG TPA: hypothetical protein VJN70_19240 [Gemmatimonadaceae bacterium]|nr:hypothetical protein [Gemmatimonadaceae bacterium]
MLNSRLLMTIAAVTLLGGGCASSPSGNSGAVTPAGSSRYVVTEAELANVGDRSVYDALLQLKPAFLRSRDTQTTSHQEVTPVHVFVDGGRTEGLDALRTIRANTVKELRFYEPEQANTRFGTGNNGGVIAVTMK